MVVFAIMGSIREGLQLKSNRIILLHSKIFCNLSINKSSCFEVHFEAHPKITEKFNEDHLRCAISEIIIGPKDNSDEVLLVIQKLREQLEQSSTEIFPFFEACSRKVHETRRLFRIYNIYHDFYYINIQYTSINVTSVIITPL